MALPETYVEGFHDLEAVKKIKYVDFGKTGLKVSNLGFGGGALGNQYGDYNLDDMIATVHEALKKGINYIDTAPYYGEGKSESTLGKALKGVPRKAYYIATKVARYSSDPSRAFDFSYERTIQSVDQSLKLLGLDYVDLIQVHDVEFAPSLDIIINETLPALEQVVKSGKARFIGVTGYPVARLKEVIDRSKTKIDAVLSYSRMTLMDDTLKDYLPEFIAKGLGVIHAAPPALELLTNRGPRDWHPANPLYKDICGKAAEFCKEQGVELGRLAVYWTMTQPGIDIHLIGMPNQEIVRANLDIAINGISEKEKKVIDEIFKRFFQPQGKRHWENVEVAQYWKNLEALGRKKFS